MKRLGFTLYGLGIIGLLVIGTGAVSVKCSVMALAALCALVGLGLRVFSPGGQNGNRQA